MTNRTPLTHMSLATALVGEDLLKAMFRLFERYYGDVDFNTFVEDLSNKTDVMLLLEKSDAPLTKRLVGFSTIRRERMTGPTGRPAHYLFSGDTVVAREHWRSKRLQVAFFWQLVRAKLTQPLTPVYWMLISKGYKTYLLLSRNFCHHHPRHVAERKDPAKASRALQPVADLYYARYFGRHYNAETGVISFDTPHGRVADGVAVPTEEDLKLADVSFFVKRNPGYAKGDELACVAEILVRDLIFHLVKYFLRPVLRTWLRARPDPVPDPIRHNSPPPRLG